MLFLIKLKQHQLIFVVWGPDEASVRKKMFFAQALFKVRRSFDGIKMEIQPTQISDFYTKDLYNRAIYRF